MSRHDDDDCRRHVRCKCEQPVLRKRRNETARRGRVGPVLAGCGVGCHGLSPVELIR